MNSSNISIVGMGAICAIGNNCNEVLAALKEQKSGIAEMQYLSSSHTELPVGEVKLSNQELKAKLSIDPSAIYSRTTLLGAVALKEALEPFRTIPNPLEQSNIPPLWEGLGGLRLALISGTTVGGMDVTEQLYKQMLTDDSVLPYIRRHDCGSSTSEIAEILGLENCEVITISTACSSALNAIMLGAEMLKNDECDVALVGGTEALSRFHLNGFNTLHILDTENCRPFDKTRVGLNLGEGAAWVVLTRDSQKAVACVSGYGNRCDAFHQTASSEDGEGAFLAMTDALKMAGVEPMAVDYVNAHGTGTPNNDPSESAALKRIFGDHVPPVSSTKGLTGHTTSASGSIETVISILCMQNGLLPANYGFNEQDESCITPLKENVTTAGINNVLVNAFGFGGNDSSLLLSNKPLEPLEPIEPFEPLCAADVVVDNMDDLKTLSSEFISPKEGRRMGKLLKVATVTSLKALKEAGVECPDAVITATKYGMLETSEKFLADMVCNGEDALSPTLFMQSTHNTIGSAIAIRTKCHGYNITYTQGEDSLRIALADAERLIKTGKANVVLVGCHDESTDEFDGFLERLGEPVPPRIYSRSIVLKRKAE